ncbi:MAG: chromosomal replication initiator DnaA [Parvibaculum sp.]|nr:chromosomal replication initiator DnaA [Parvibaculum sp.]
MGIEHISAETGIWPLARTRRDRERAAQVALMQETVALAWNVPIAEIRSPTRRKAAVAQARQVAMYLTHVIYGFSLSAVGRHFGRDRTTAAHACRLVEDRRDDKNFDMLLDRLEQALRSANTGPMRQ